MNQETMSEAEALKTDRNTLGRLAETHDLPAPAMKPSERVSFEEIAANRLSLGKTAKAMLVDRKFQKNFEFSIMVFDPALDILLELFVNWSEGKLMRFKDVVLSTGLSNGTAQRYLKMMADINLLARTAHPTDARVTFYEITHKGLVELGSYLSGMPANGTTPPMLRS